MKRIFLLFFIISLLALAGCGTKVSDIKENSDDYLGKELTIRGTAMNPINGEC